MDITDSLPIGSWSLPTGFTDDEVVIRTFILNHRLRMQNLDEERRKLLIAKIASGIPAKVHDRLNEAERLAGLAA